MGLKNYEKILEKSLKFQDVEESEVTFNIVKDIWGYHSLKCHFLT
jgi:hypothetical protein